MELSKEQIEKSKTLISETKAYLKLIEDIIDKKEEISERCSPLIDKILFSVIKLNHCQGNDINKIKEIVNKL
jgi:hypothetical protein